MWSIYAVEYYSAIRKNDYPTFAATLTGLEEIMLNESNLLILFPTCLQVVDALPVFVGRTLFREASV